MPNPRAHQVLASVSRVAVLEILRQAERPLAVQDLANRMGLHPNTIRAHLDLLVEFGHVRYAAGGEGRPGRPRRLYVAVPGSEPAPSPQAQQRNFRLLADVLARYLGSADDPQAAAVSAGRLAGERMVDAPRDGDPAPVQATLDRVLALLDDIGFQPELAEDRRAILLHNCPFHEIAREQPDIVCNIHLGLLRGALEQLGAPVEATRLIPFVTPTLCVAELRFAPPDPDRSD